MRIKTVPSLAELRRHLEPGYVARSCNNFIQLYYLGDKRGEDTPARLTANDAFASAATGWTGLSPAQQRGWKAYRNRYAPLLVAKNKAAAPAAHLLYTACASRQILLDVPVTQEPPDAPPPESPQRLELCPFSPAGDSNAGAESNRHPGGEANRQEASGLAGTGGDLFAFQVWHKYAAGTSMQLLVKITPQTLSRRKPFLDHARLIRGNNPASAQPLPEPGGLVTFNNARFAVFPEQRFGVAAQIVRLSDGMASPVLWLDVYR